MEEQVLRGTRVAFFGGSFDPPHLGHLAIAEAAQASLALDTVLFAPVGYQPLKPKGSTAGFKDRMAMTELAIAGKPGFEISAIDAPKADGRPNYTVDTLARLKSQMAADSALYFLMGADSFLNLKKWHRAAEIPFLAPLIVAFRPGESMDDMKAALPPGLSVETTPARARAGEPSAPASAVEVVALRNETGQTTPFFLLPGLHENVSASQIRENVRALTRADGDAAAARLPGSEKALLPASVLAYILEHGLYC
jgi:nicotinate-nucleotide adenylyltransferase